MDDYGSGPSRGFVWGAAIATRIHPQAGKEFDDGVSVGWHRVPWALGCYGLYTDETRENESPVLYARRGA
ncbi:hypothetical protein GCM10010840_18580 [Deinococcus aerolatus]|uniref:Uncharacterized protein n=1 Tax=Deinococcus aerolatus TaxID=522487 RepID=A0ABQ2G905_9DEIO|nr:hypothetical protein [Deinococcus aerolatus]GGL81059.1 hypothetical protein GCM10010840_18580 [Deinococcus aerolatus]